MKNLFKTLLLSVSIFLISGFLNRVHAQCDTISNILTTDNLTIYLSDNWGYVAGHNGYSDDGKADRFSNQPAGNTITGAGFLFGVGHTSNTGKFVVATVWDANGTGGSPGTVLATAAIQTSTIAADVLNGDITWVTFPNPPTVGANYFVGITYSYASPLDTVALVTTEDRASGVNTAWERWDTGTWYAYNSSSSWGLSLSHVILPITCGGTTPINDIAIADASFGEYTMYPKGQVRPVPFSAEIANNGNQVANNVTLTVRVFDFWTSSLLYTGTANQATLNVGGTTTLAPATSFTPSDTGIYEVQYQITMTQPDANPSDNTGTLYFAVDDSWFARDEWILYGNTIQGLGFGFGNTMYFGQVYELTAPALLDEVNYLHGMDSIGNVHRASVFNFNPATGPTTLIANSVNYSPTQDTAATIATVAMQGGPVALNPGFYFVGITGVGFLGYGQEVFTPGRVWGGDPVGGWGTLESFGFPGVAFIWPSFLSTSNCGSFAVSGTTQASVCAANNGSAAVTATGGTSPYSYIWNTSQTSSSISNLAPGTYTVTVSDAAGCDTTLSLIVAQDNGNLVAVASVIQNVSCRNGNDGAGTVNVTGGTPPYTYTWLNPALQVISTSQSPTNFTAGFKIIRVTDANGCLAADTIQITQPAQALTAGATSTAATCLGINTGTATGSASGGTPPYTYAWTGGLSGTNLSNLAPGTYVLTVTDNNGCTATASTTVGSTAPSPNVTFPFFSDPSCNASDGFIQGSANQGVTPYTYLWSTGAGTTSINNLPPGTYTLTVTGANGCQGVNSLTLVDADAPQLFIFQAAPISCNGACDGSVAVIVTQGNGFYTYAWSTGASNDTITGLCAGSYTVTVTDLIASCATIVSFNLTEPAVLATTSTVTNVTCFGGNNGAVTLATTGGTSPYNYTWATGGTINNPTGLTAGSYDYTVTDSRGCQTTGTATVNQPSEITATTSSTPVTCFGGNDGSASISATGGTGSLSYSWPGGQGGTNVSGLTAGNYVITVTDANNCSVTFTEAVTQPTAVTVSYTVTHVSCNGGNDGMINGSATGGAGGYSWVWSSGPTTNMLSNLAAGQYVATVTDASGCTGTATANIFEPDVLTISVSATNVNCAGGSDGSLTATSSGGTSPYTYTWSGGGSTGLGAGSYSVTVTDSKGCTAIGTADVMEPSALLISSVDVTGETVGQANGAISLTVTGGSPTYSYNWSNGGNTSFITGLTAGTYTVTVTDGNGCQTTEEIVVPLLDNVSIIELVKSFEVYPNPVEHTLFVNIQFVKPENFAVEVVNLLGERIYAESITNGDSYMGAINLSNQSSGIYFLRVLSKEGSFTRKVVLTK